LNIALNGTGLVISHTSIKHLLPQKLISFNLRLKAASFKDKQFKIYVTNRKVTGSIPEEITGFYN
jgi:hypothetical protein